MGTAEIPEESRGIGETPGEEASLPPHPIPRRSALRRQVEERKPSQEVERERLRGCQERRRKRGGRGHTRLKGWGKADWTSDPEVREPDDAAQNPVGEMCGV